AKTNQAIDSRPRRSRQKSGRFHGARAAWSNRNAGCRLRGRAGDRSHSSAHAGNSGAWSSGRNANMNGGANSRESLAGIHLSEDPMKASQELRPPLNVRWLGRMEFATALNIQEELVARKRENASLEDQLLLLEHDPVYTIGRTPDRSSLSAPGFRLGKDGEFG